MIGVDVDEDGGWLAKYGIKCEVEIIDASFRSVSNSVIREDETQQPIAKRKKVARQICEMDRAIIEELGGKGFAGPPTISGFWAIRMRR